MGHGHHHHHVGAETGDRRLAGAIAVNLVLTLAQIVGGVVAGSLALIADAIHNLSDAVSLVIAFAARRIARRPADAGMPYGYGRAELVAALINYTSLTLIGIYLAWEAIWRLVDPQPVEGWIVVIIAGLALVVDAVTALLTWAMAKDSVNIRAAFLHNLADAAASVAVIVAGTLILLFGWWIADPLITLLIAGYILWMSLSELPEVIRTLMLGAPTGADPEAVLRTMRAVEGVADVHNAHLWQVQEHEIAFEGHVVIAAGRWAEADAIKARLKQRLHDDHGVEHATLELECAAHACDNGIKFGH